MLLSSRYIASATTKISVTSGSWNNPASWSPSGIPVAGDDVIISTGTSINISSAATAKSVNVNSGGNLTWSPQRLLTLNGNFIINGSCDLSSGNILQQLTGASFTIGNNASFIWNPDDNTVAGASLFINSTENFSATSTLIIRKWYSFTTVPLGQVVTGDFGNVTISTLAGNTLFAWNQQNEFEHHKISGTLTIENGWVVLDTTGRIRNTSIGNIVLSNINSYLDLHFGNHPSSFTVTTNSVTNNGGALTGIYNGNGDVTLKIKGNFTNSGNTVLIYNTGVQGTGNGKAIFNVDGNYQQTAGDMRGVFNLSATAAGSAEMNFGSLNLSGGIMMAYYACNNSSDTCKINVTGNAEINFANASDKFRVNGLTTLWGHYSNSKSELHIGGNLSLTGHAAAEFTSSGSIGNENIYIAGNFVISGLINNFNYGNHATGLIVGGNLEISGGTTCLSKTTGTLTAFVNNDLILSSGNFSAKGNNGIADLTINRNYIQTGGIFLLHDNPAVSISDVISVTINGIFSQLNGILNFDNNIASSASHKIEMKGTQINLSGNGKITRAGEGVSNVFGTIHYNHQGIQSYSRLSNSHITEQVKQYIFPGCTIAVVAGNFQVASHQQPTTDLLKILPGGIVHIYQSQIISNNKAQHSSLLVENGGRLQTENIEGLYNSSGNATISDLDYFLNENSIVEYCGNHNQLLTEGAGIKAYGILEINKTNSRVCLAGNISVRQKIILRKGELNLNGKKLTSHSSLPDAITRIGGYIKSDIPLGNISWKNISTGNYEFPFGQSDTEYVPVVIHPVAGTGDISINAWHTDAGNFPMPSGISQILFNGQHVATSKTVKRWFSINAAGIKANVLLNFSDKEKSISTVFTEHSVLSWENNSFRQINSFTEKPNSVSVKNCSAFSHWIIASKQPLSTAPYFYMVNASYSGKKTLIEWVFEGEQPGDNYIVERSTDGEHFELLTTIKADASAEYDFTDVLPLKGISYYRVKQFNASGTYKYSETRQVNTETNNAAQIDFIHIGPVPFNEILNIDYFSGIKELTQIELISSIGQTVYSCKNQSQQGRNHFEITQQNHLSPGTYIVSLKAHGTRISRKILKR